MEKAKAFVRVCAGMFLLALGFHLGALTAASQSAHTIEGVSWTNSGLSAVVDGVSFVFDPSTGTRYAEHPIPVAGHVVETAGSDRLVYDNGDVYVYQSSAGAWVFQSNLASGPTSAQQHSWGSVKARYRQ